MSSVETIMSEHEVADIVRHYLARREPKGLRIEVLEQAVYRDGDWWYVPVRTDNEPPRTFQYYDDLAEVETDITETEHLKVMLVPSA